MHTAIKSIFCQIEWNGRGELLFSQQTRQNHLLPRSWQHQLVVKLEVDKQSVLVGSRNPRCV